MDGREVGKEDGREEGKEQRMDRREEGKEDGREDRGWIEERRERIEGIRQTAISSTVVSLKANWPLQRVCWMEVHE